jgi:hypothetical protein
VIAVPFRHPDRSHDLGTRIEFEVRERLEEAVDYVCLDALVRARRARGLPPPAADNPDDRRAYTANVLAFLELLRRDLSDALSAEDLRKLPTPSADGDPQAHLIAVQVALARRLPDYWQRFEAAQARYLASPTLATANEVVGSRGEGRSLLARLFGRR